MPKKTYFCNDWLLDPDYKNVIMSDEKDKTVAICKICPASSSSRIINLSNMSKRALASHCAGQRHQNYLKNVSQTPSLLLFAAANGSQATTNNAGEGTAPGAALNQLVNSNQREIRGVRGFILRDDVTRAEAWWCLYTVQSHISLRSAGVATKIFPKMFTDSQIATKIELGKTKIAYNINYGLAPYFHDALIEKILQTDAYVACFDESLNNVAQKQQMDVSIRFWSKESDEVSTNYFNSSFLLHTTADDLRPALLSALRPLDLNKLLELSMDGPNVNLKLVKDLETYLIDNNDPGTPVFLFKGSCGLHVLNNAFKAGFKDKVVSWDIISFLRALYNLFKDIPARKSDLIQASGSTLMPLKFCSVRWLNNSNVALRAKQMLPALESFIEFIKKAGKSKEITSKSYSNVKNAVGDKLISCKLAFFVYIASEIEPFLTRYQSDHPMAPFLYTDLSSLLVNFLSMIVKKDIMDKETSFFKLDLSKNSTCFIPAKHFSLNFSVKAEVKKIKLSELELLQFKKDCCEIVRCICVKLLDKSPLKYFLTRYITFCNPAVISAKNSPCIRRLENCLTVFQEKFWLPSSDCDIILREFKNLFKKSAFLISCKEYDDTQRLDHFWRGIVAVHKVTDVTWKFIKKVLILSQGNASVERGFSINKEVLVENQLESSLIAQRQVYDGLQALGGFENLEEIDKKMILKLRNSRALYQEALENRRKKNLKEAAEKVNKRNLVEEIENLRKKRMKIIHEKEAEISQINEELNNLTGGTKI